jgi:hypothetical protein
MSITAQEEEIRTNEQRISHLEADMQEFEKSNHTKEVELREALDNSDKYI